MAGVSGKTYHASVTTDLLQRWPDSHVAHIVGDSMEPTLLNADVVLVDHGACDPSSGDVVAVRIEGARDIVGRFDARAEGCFLAKDNRAYDAVPLPRDRTTILGTVRAVVHRRIPLPAAPPSVVPSLLRDVEPQPRAT